MQMWYNSLRFINMGIGPFAGDTSFFPLAERTLARALGAGGGRDRLGERRPRPRRFSDSLSLLLSSSSMSSSASSSSLESSSSSWYRRICWSFCRAAATAAARVLFVPDEVEAIPLVEVLGSGSIDCLDFPELPEVVATSDSQNIKLRNGKANKVSKKKILLPSLESDSLSDDDSSVFPSWRLRFSWDSSWNRETSRPSGCSSVNSSLSTTPFSTSIARRRIFSVRWRSSSGNP